MVPPKAIAPIYTDDPMCPINIMSTKPKSGMVMLLIMLGIANFKMDLFTMIMFLQIYEKKIYGAFIDALFSNVY